MLSVLAIIAVFRNEETHVRGVSVANVARRHEVNANQVFTWRQLYRRGLLEVSGAHSAPTMLPVTVMKPTVLPTSAAARAWV